MAKLKAFDSKNSTISFGTHGKPTPGSASKIKMGLKKSGSGSSLHSTSNRHKKSEMRGFMAATTTSAIKEMQNAASTSQIKKRSAGNSKTANEAH